jgi:hypothetical protein
MNYLHDRFEKIYTPRFSELNMGIGAMKSLGMAFILQKYLPRKEPSLVFLEHAINDNEPNLDNTRIGIEGLIRQVRSYGLKPDIVVLRGASQPDSDWDKKARTAWEIHTEVAAHYGATCIDVNAYVHRILSSRGQDWDAVGLDEVHMNAYGNQIWYDCLREWFEDQVRLYEEDPMTTEETSFPEPLYSSELESTRLVNPARKSRFVKLEGDWCADDDVKLPWYMENVLVGRPGARLTFNFKGTAVVSIAMHHPNGLKMEAKLDGVEIPGPYTTWMADFGHVMLLKRSMEDVEHELELVVDQPQRGRNLDDPTVRLAYLGVAGGKQG